MTDQTDDSELKLVDFGLSKILGPNESSTDPFGTLVNQSITLTFYFSLMLLLKYFYKSLMVKMLTFGA
jgi:hypothetical protein